MAPSTHRRMRPSVSIIVPLYLYPINQLTWRPLFEVIAQCNNTNFIIIINPNSGPGVEPDGWQPDKRYSGGILKLKAFVNVTLVGYVRLDYCRRPLSDVRTDIEKYAGWSQKSFEGQQYLSMNGIFFDEVPNIFTEAIAEQLASLSKIVRKAKGFSNESWVIHNPGTIPDIEFLAFWTKISSLSSSSGQDDCEVSAGPLDSSDFDHEEFVEALERVPTPERSRIEAEPDLVVIFEGPYDNWRQTAVQERMAKLSRYDRSQCCHIVHSVPHDSLRELFTEIKFRGSHLYLTDLSERFYESFGQSWKKFSDMVEVANLVPVEEP